MIHSIEMSPAVRRASQTFRVMSVESNQVIRSALCFQAFIQTVVAGGVTGEQEIPLEVGP